MPTTASSPTGSPARYIRAASRNPTHAMAATTTSQSTVPGSPSGPRRSRKPRTDWLAVPALGPSRVGSRSAKVQYVHEVPGRTAAASSVATAADATAVAASFQRRVRRKWTTKTPASA